MWLGGLERSAEHEKVVGSSGIPPLGQLIDVSHINQRLSHRCLFSSLPPSLKTNFLKKKEKYPGENTLRIPIKYQKQANKQTGNGKLRSTRSGVCKTFTGGLGSVDPS